MKTMPISEQNSTELRRQILEDVLGEHVEEYENFDKSSPIDNKRPHRQRIPLWQFIVHLLRRDKKSHYIRWSADRVLEFRILDTVGVASLWGSVKNKTDMTYEKLGRAMRYYYGKSIIEKVSGKRYTYRFIYSRRTKKYLTQFINIADNVVEEVSVASCKKSSTIEEEIDDSCSESVVPDSRPGTPDEMESESPIPSPQTDYDCHKDIEEQAVEYSGVETMIINKPVKIQPVKPTPCQTVMKTKIFMPDKLMERNFTPSFPSLLKQSNFTKDENRRSAFVAPYKNIDASKTRIFQAKSIFDRQPYPLKHDVMLNQSVSKKRKYPNSKSICSCGSALCTAQSTGTNKIDTSTVFDTAAIKDVETSITFKHPRKDDFILRRDILAKQNIQLQNLQLKLHKKADPFMGYDYYRYDSDYERCEQYYDTLDDYTYETTHRKHAWTV